MVLANGAAPNVLLRQARLSQIGNLWERFWRIAGWETRCLMLLHWAKWYHRII